MFTTRPLRCGLYLLAIIVLFLAMTWLTGCTPIRRLDEAMWAQWSTDPNSPLAIPGAQVGHDPTAAPPIVEGIAAALAALGFPGMAYWIHRNKKNGVGQLTEITSSLSALQLKIAAIEGRFEAARTNGQS